MARPYPSAAAAPPRALFLPPPRSSLTAMLLAALALLAAAPPKAAPARASVPPQPVTEVSPMTVYPPTPMPKLVASYPADGGTVTPGVLVLKLTFDQKMSRGSFADAPVTVSPVAAATGPDAPLCLKTPRLLDDGRTFVLLCTLRAGRAYKVAFNSASTGGFANYAEHRADPVSFAFTTTRDDPIRSLDEAMKVQGLTNLDIPVQESPSD